jgi:hypothetical protein
MPSTNVLSWKNDGAEEMILPCMLADYTGYNRRLYPVEY